MDMIGILRIIVGNERNTLNYYLSNKSDLSNYLKESDSEVFIIMGAGDIADEVEIIKNNILF